MFRVRAKRTKPCSNQRRYTHSYYKSHIFRGDSTTPVHERWSELVAEKQLRTYPHQLQVFTVKTPFLTEKAVEHLDRLARELAHYKFSDLQVKSQEPPQPQKTGFFG